MIEDLSDVQQEFIYTGFHCGHKGSKRHDLHVDALMMFWKSLKQLVQDSGICVSMPFEAEQSLLYVLHFLIENLNKIICQILADLICIQLKLLLLGKAACSPS